MKKLDFLQITLYICKLLCESNRPVMISKWKTGLDQIMVDDRWSATRIANSLGVTPQTIKSWRDGTTCPSAKHGLALAELLGRDLPYIISVFSEEESDGKTAD